MIKGTVTKRKNRRGIPNGPEVFYVKYKQDNGTMAQLHWNLISDRCIISVCCMKVFSIEIKQANNTRMVVLALIGY
jgi:hypothetical protein